MNNLSTKQLDKTPLLSTKHLCKTYKEGSLVTEVLKMSHLISTQNPCLPLLVAPGSGKKYLITSVRWIR
ncbi:hypothetical protein PT276_06500 [Orbaceae bacterium ESL0721]|nr:hypothetical protein [Orbaceae bacterium ESL0721]